MRVTPLISQTSSKTGSIKGYWPWVIVVEVGAAGDCGMVVALRGSRSVGLVKLDGEVLAGCMKQAHLVVHEVDTTLEAFGTGQSRKWACCTRDIPNMENKHDVPAGKLPEARAVPGQDKGPGRGEGQHDEGKHRVASHGRRADAARPCGCCVLGGGWGRGWPCWVVRIMCGCERNKRMPGYPA